MPSQFMRESMASVYVNNPAAAIVSPMQSKGSLNELTSEGYLYCVQRVFHGS